MPTSLTFGPDGFLYVTTLDDRVQAMKDFDADGVADTLISFATGMINPTGLFHDGTSLFVSFRGEVARYRDLDGDHVADEVVSILSGIPVGAGRNYDLTMGPDGWLYVGVGAATNLGMQAHPWSATILRFTVQGDSVEIFATGVRVAYDLAFHVSGALFAADNGPSADTTLCYEAPDELNWIRQGQDYGFPSCFGFGDCADVGAFCSPAPCGAGDCDFGGCGPNVTDPIALFDPHSSADGIAFGNGFAGFGANDLFVAEFGQTAASGGCNTNFGHRVSLVRLRQEGPQWLAGTPEPFVTGLGRPLDVAVGPDGALYIADYERGTIDRVFRLDLSAADEGIPGRSGRFRIGPNPAIRQVRLNWELESSNCQFDVFDVLGRRTARIRIPRGRSFLWNLQNAEGQRLQAGLYFLSLTCGGTTETRKLLVVPAP